MVQVARPAAAIANWFGTDRRSVAASRCGVVSVNTGVPDRVNLVSCTADLFMFIIGDMHERLECERIWRAATAPWWFTCTGKLTVAVLLALAEIGKAGLEFP